MSNLRRATRGRTHDGLLGFTGSTVTVRFSSTIYTYNEKGMTLSAKAA
jgi:hypothetical protein